MQGEWHSETPDGREVVVRRRGDLWLVRCGRSHGRSTNLDAALAQAIRADADVIGHGVDPPDWLRAAADTIARRADPEGRG